jgi:hypothetical protein
LDCSRSVCASPRSWDDKCVPPHSAVGWDGISWTFFCPSCLQTSVLLIFTPRVARITGVSHHAWTALTTFSWTSTLLCHSLLTVLQRQNKSSWENGSLQNIDALVKCNHNIYPAMDGRCSFICKRFFRSYSFLLLLLCLSFSFSLFYAVVGLELRTL